MEWALVTLSFNNQRMTINTVYHIPNLHIYIYILLQNITFINKSDNLSALFLFTLWGVSVRKEKQTKCSSLSILSYDFIGSTAPWKVCVRDEHRWFHRAPLLQPGCSLRSGPAPSTRPLRCPAEPLEWALLVVDSPRKKTPPVASSTSCDPLWHRPPPPAESGRGTADPLSAPLCYPVNSNCI